MKEEEDKMKTTTTILKTSDSRLQSNNGLINSSSFCLSSSLSLFFFLSSYRRQNSLHHLDIKWYYVMQRMFKRRCKFLFSNYGWLFQSHITNLDCQKKNYNKNKKKLNSLIPSRSQILRNTIDYPWERENRYPFWIMKKIHVPQISNRTKISEYQTW